MNAAPYLSNACAQPRRTGGIAQHLEAEYTPHLQRRGYMIFKEYNPSHNPATTA